MNMKQIAFQRRLDVLEMDYRAQTGHIGGAMSAMDILVCLYYGVMDTEKIRRKEPGRDRFVMSKGHCAEALYSVLADLGFFPKSEMETYAAFDTRLAEHPTQKVPGVEMATGALGHGLSLAAGMACGLRQDAPAAHVYVLMGDGEQDEGSIWEAAMLASKLGLDNLTAVIDRNGLQISGPTETVLPLESLADKYKAFGWAIQGCDGHDHEQLNVALRARTPGKPTVVVAHTTKGYGCELMEGKAEWHHLVPSDEEYLCVKNELLRRGG